MPDQLAVSLDEVANRLKTGVTTLNVWRKRYQRWMPEALDGQGRLFPATIVDLFRLIDQCVHVGMDADDIERVLETKTVTSPPDQGQGGREALAVIDAFKETIAGLSVHQQRIADAQERRATAEERKAFALESQAEAELVKANALRDMVTLFQDMTVKDSVMALMDKVKNMPGPTPINLDDYTLDRGYSPEQLEDLPEIEDIMPLEPSEALQDPTPGFESEAEPIAQPSDDLVYDVDDLSLLLADDSPASVGHDSVDDLSALLDPEELMGSDDIDDLSLLLDEGEVPTTSAPQAVGHDAPIDNLSQLIEPDDRPPNQGVPKEPRRTDGLDESYKAKILKRIIAMKQKDNLSVEEVTRRFNDEGVKTLSGKGLWDTKTIQGIYAYIDSVQAG